MTELLKPSLLREFHINNVTLFEDEELGSGAYGKVCRAKYGDLPCAAKLLHPVLFRYSTAGTHSVTIRKFEQECQLLSMVKHPCIVQYLATYIHPESGQPVLLMELIDESLTRFLESATKPIPLHIQTNITHNIALALAYLHTNEIIHRDLTGNNVLVVAGKYAKVTDFGMLKIVDSQMESNPRLRQMTLCPGCPAYMPPEAFKNPPKYTKKLDVFSLGVIIIQILTRQFPKPRDASRNEDEIERRRSHISRISPTHSLLPVALQCIRNKDKERPSAADICRELAGIKETPRYLESVQSETGSSSELDQLTQELQSTKEEVSRLKAQLENLRAENRQLYRVIDSGRENSMSPRKPFYIGGARNGAAVLPRVPSLENSLDESMRKIDIDYESFSDEEMDLESSTPPPAVWFHGKIDRDLASKRLHSVGRPGAYLVRNSESTPGSYVLMFLDKEKRAFNYMIHFKDGQYNASGQSKRWFPSLQQLIGYYTKFSTVKQNQHLDVPVVPPEVVPLPPVE